MSITAGIADGSSPHTSAGVTVVGFENGGLLGYDNLILTSIVPGKSYVFANTAGTVFGQINTEYKIANGTIRYLSVDGTCYQATMQDNPTAGFNLLTKI